MDKRNPHQTAVKKITKLFFVIQLFISTNVFGAYPPDYTATYDIEKFGTTIGHSTVTLNQNDDDEVHYSQNVKLVGFISLFKSDRVAENSWLTIDRNDEFLLKRYQYIHSNSNKNTDSLFEAVWTENIQQPFRGIITGNSRGTNISLTTSKKIWDTFSFQLQLISDAESNKTSLNYPVISHGIIKEYLFSYAGEETIEIDEKNYTTVIVERHNGKKHTRIWLATQLHYIPILIENYKNDALDNSLTLDTITFHDSQTENTSDE